MKLTQKTHMKLLILYLKHKEIEAQRGQELCSRSHSDDTVTVTRTQVFCATVQGTPSRFALPIHPSHTITGPYPLPGLCSRGDHDGVADG